MCNKYTENFIPVACITKHVICIYKCQETRFILTANYSTE